MSPLPPPPAEGGRESGPHGRNRKNGAMQTPSKFAMSLHVLAMLDVLDGAAPSSALLAASVGTHPVLVRRLLGALRRAGLVRTVRGSRGAALARPAREITLLEVHRAVVGAKHEVIDLHAHPNPRCPVGRNIAAALEAPFEEARRAVERTLARRTVASVSAPIRAAVRRERAWKAQGAAEP